MNASSTSTAAQRARLLAYLSDSGPINTIQARNSLNIMMPAARVKELRAQGHGIDTVFITALDGEGRSHRRVALYVYRNAPEVSK